MGEAPNNMTLVDGPAHVQEIEIDPTRPVAWLSQTTLSVDETLETVDLLRAKFPNLLDPPSDDICYATQNRQKAVKEISAACDLMLVVGSANSSNTVRLVDVALEAGAKAAYRVDFAGEIDETWFANVQTVGLTSGASVPEILVNSVLAWLGKHGYSDVEEVETIEEHLIFALPPELRRDIKAAERA
jgi:4-hydroxy-3-methylbut-2-enyl diphosphate reductase